MMKVLLARLVLIPIVISANLWNWKHGDLEKYGPVAMVLNSNIITCNHDKTLNLDASEIFVYFYDFAYNETIASRMDDAFNNIANYKKLNKSNKFVIFVGGYRSSIANKNEGRVRKSFEDVPNTYLIIIDHSAYTNEDPTYRKGYERSVKYAYYIARRLAILLVRLTERGVIPRNFQCIGHSLGCQIIGYIGEVYKNITDRMIGRLTALDPAGPCYSSDEHQVRSGEAEYVEVYHCNMGMLGSNSVLADIDFFVNRKGKVQPMCKTPLIPGIVDSTLAAQCNHRACLEIYLATVTNKDWFVATQCDSYTSYKNGSCSDNNLTLAGFWNPLTARGKYYFSTDINVL